MENSNRTNIIQRYIVPELNHNSARPYDYARVGVLILAKYEGNGI